MKTAVGAGSPRAEDIHRQKRRATAHDREQWPLPFLPSVILLSEHAAELGSVAGISRKHSFQVRGAEVLVSNLAEDVAEVSC